MNNSGALNHTDLNKMNDIKLVNICLAMFLSCFSLLTICGNLLVITAVLIERYLRSITNYFIVSLAIADLFMGLIVMPFAIFNIVTDNWWPFGQVWCDLWHALDVLSSTASILNLCMIAIERYWATQSPLNFATKVNKTRCVGMIVTVWVCSSLISFPAIYWWRLVTPLKNYQCIFTEDKVYLIFSSIVSFYGPLLVMVVVYYKIYKTATTLVKSLNEGSKVIYNAEENGESMTLRIHRGGLVHKPTPLLHIYECPDSDEQMNSPSIEFSNKNDKTDFSELSTPHGTYTNRFYSSAGNSEASSLLHSSRYTTANRDVEQQQSNEHEHICDVRAGPNQKITQKIRRFAVGKRLSKFAREQKAAKTLGIVMGIFIFCWMPFFICNVIMAIDKTVFTGAAQHALMVVTWLGYLNSGVNPIIYAHSMRDFRRGFVRLLCSCCVYNNPSRRIISSEDKAQVRAAVLAIASSVELRPRYHQADCQEMRYVGRGRPKWRNTIVDS